MAVKKIQGVSVNSSGGFGAASASVWYCTTADTRPAVADGAKSGDFLVEADTSAETAAKYVYDADADKWCAL